MPDASFSYAWHALIHADAGAWLGAFAIIGLILGVLILAALTTKPPHPPRNVSHTLRIGPMSTTIHKQQQCPWPGTCVLCRKHAKPGHTATLKKNSAPELQPRELACYKSDHDR